MVLLIFISTFRSHACSRPCRPSQFLTLHVSNFFYIPELNHTPPSPTGIDNILSRFQATSACNFTVPLTVFNDVLIVIKNRIVSLRSSPLLNRKSRLLQSGTGVPYFDPLEQKDAPYKYILISCIMYIIDIDRMFRNSRKRCDLHFALHLLLTFPDLQIAQPKCMVTSLTRWIAICFNRSCWLP